MNSMVGPARLGRALRWLLVGLLAVVLLSAVERVEPAAAAGSAAERGRVRGEIRAVRGASPQVKLLWFDHDWGYLGARRFSGGAYSLSLAPGTYYLQAVDQAPAYDVTKAAPTTVKVAVRAGHTTVKTLTMRRGASIGGKVRAGGKPAPGARIVAANTDEQSYETTADKTGSFALGGLPPGNYSVFTYDRKGTWVDKSLYLPRLKGPDYHPVSINLRKRSGGLLVDLYAGGKPMTRTAFITAVSRATGQFWTAKASRGSVTFRGLYPGSYDLQVPGVGNYLPARLHVKARVRPGRVAFGSARLIRRGGWITGTVVDGGKPTQTLGDARVRLYDADGTQLDEYFTKPDGRFTLDGQLVTQKGMTVVVSPRYSPYMGTDPTCQFGTTKVKSVQIRTGERTNLGSVGLERLPADQQEQGPCQPAPGPVKATS